MGAGMGMGMGMGIGIGQGAGPAHGGGTGVLQQFSIQAGAQTCGQGAGQSRGSGVGVGTTRGGGAAPSVGGGAEKKGNVKFQLEYKAASNASDNNLCVQKRSLFGTYQERTYETAFDTCDKH